MPRAAAVQVPEQPEEHALPQETKHPLSHVSVQL